jgi:hypothetical protein
MPVAVRKMQDFAAIRHGSTPFDRTAPDFVYVITAFARCSCKVAEIMLK